jgi:hypothetical protein
MGGWHLRMTWGQEVCYVSLHSEPASALGLLTIWSLLGNPGMARCWEMSTLPARYIPQQKATWASSSGSLGFIVCVKCCRMVDSVPRWGLSLSWPIQSDHLSIADCDDTTFGAGTLTWQDPVHSWKAGPGEVMTVENLLFIYYVFY